MSLSISDFEISFYEEVEGTYVVGVSVEHESFLVNCQQATNHNYVLTNELSCHNESGGDFTDSGLQKYLDDNDLSHLEDELADLIVKEAESHFSAMSKLEYLENETGLSLSEANTLADANYSNNCYLEKYIAETGEIVIADIDDNKIVADEVVLNHRVFDSKAEYSKWFDESTEDHTENWSGDCSLAYVLQQAL